MGGLPVTRAGNDGPVNRRRTSPWRSCPMPWRGEGLEEATPVGHLPVAGMVVGTEGAVVGADSA
jgi:hypothetical protein